MKKKNRVASFALIVLTAIAGFTCKQNIGLGGRIDILPPNGEITYPDSRETPIRGSFVLKGTARDDDGIKSISVVFENIDTKEKTKVYDAERFSEGDVSVSWTINVNNESTGTEAGHDLVKVYPIPDGEYTAILSVTDKGGKTTTFTKPYKIDNTPPVFIVSRPSTTVGAADMTTPQADGYGATFSVVGQAGEKNTVEKLDVRVPGIEPIKKLFVGKNINTQIAVYSKTPPKNPLYDLQAQDKTKPLRGEFYLYDNAREYTGGDASGEGNKADWYYQWDAIYTGVIAKGYTPEVISDYFAGKKGSDKNDHDKKIKALREDTAALTQLKTAMIKMSDMRSTFKLDPSISPGFKVIGTKNLPKNTLNLVQATSMLFKAGSETAFSVELIRNKDNTPLVGGSTLDAYKASNIEIVLLKWNGTGIAEDSFKTGSNLTEIPLLKFSDLTDTSAITVENGNVRIKCVFPTAKGEGYYAVQVKGTDNSGDPSHCFEAYDSSNSVNDGMYIINFLAIGTGPRIRPIRPQGYQKGNFEIFADITGIDGSGVVYYNIDAPVNDASPDATKTLTKADPSNPSDPKYKTTINISTLGDGDHEIHFFVKSGSGSSDTDKTTFAVDTKAPSADIGFPLPTDPQAGKITISGTINDGSGSGVKEAGTKYILGKKPSTPALTDSGWQNMTTSTKGSWNVDVDLDTMSAHPGNYGTQVGTSSYYKVPLYIRTEDMLGNATVHTKEILFNSDGTKPVVRVLSPQADAVVGGTIQIFGTASAVTGGPSAVGEVYVQFSKTTDFTNVSNMTFGTSGGGYDSNWYQGGNGQRVPGTGSGPGEKGSEWRLEINGNGAFNGASQRQDVYFRFRAKNKNNNRMGEWTTPIKIIVDKDAPVITDVKIDNASGASSPQNYETNMWIGSGKKLTAKLTDPSGIKEVKITSSKMSGGISYTQATAPAGWLTPYTGSGVSGYTLSIPLDISGMSGNDFSIKVEITENTTTGLKSDSTFTFRFDTTVPKGFFGSSLYINSGYFGDSSVRNDALADKLRDLGANPSSGAGCKILADNTELTVTGVSGSTVSFTPSTTAKEYNYILYKPETLIYNEGSSSPWIVNGVANDDGSGVAKVEAWVTVDNGATTHTIITETDNTNKITRQLGGQVTWKGQINLSSLKDGKGTLHYKITDKSGNTYNAPPVDVRVKNKPVKVSKVILQTEIGGEMVKTDKLNPAETDPQTTVTPKTESDLNQSVTVVSKNFAFKSKTNSKIKVEYSGGQGTVKYRLKKGNVEVQSLTAVPTNGEIDLANHFGTGQNQISNSNGTPTTITLELWDEAYGFAQGNTSSSAKVDITTLFDALDQTNPTVVILPFHWNKEDDNSLYQNSRANGHVEIDTSSVSGKVTIYGFAYDNVKLDKIEATFQDASPLNVTATRTGNTWASNKTMTANNAELKVTHLGADYLGYYVKWELSFDSSKISMGAAKDIKVIANDGGRNSVESEGTGIPTTFNTVTRGADNSASHASFASAKVGQFVVFRTGEKQYFTRISGKNANTITLANSVPTEMKEAAVYDYTANKTKTAVKSVPYITSLARESKYNTNRSTSGAYNLLRGDKFTVTGFNLGGTGATLKAIVPNGTTNGLEITISSGTFTLPSAAKSGKVKITADGVEAINNSTNNSKPYNRQELANRPETQYWTDDLTIDVWKDDEAFEGSDNPKYPSMAMGSNGDLYAAFSNYSDASVFYSKIGTGASSIKEAFHAYDQPEEAAITVTGTDTVNILYSANYHGGYPANWKSLYSGAGGLYCYDKNAKSFDYDFGRIKGKFYRFELFYHNKQLQQFKNFRLARKSNGIHITYYDTLANSIKYSMVDASSAANGDLLNDRHEIAWVDLDGGNDIDVETDIQLKRVGTVAKLVDGSSGQFENDLTRTGSTAEYCALALDGSNRPVVVYADVDTGTLRLARANAETPTAATHWKVQKVLLAGDDNEGLAADYFAAQFDSAGYLHIVFRNTKGQICYVKSTNNNAGASAYTFGKSIVIAENGSWVELTMDGTTPYVAYLSKTNTYDGVQIAYYDAELVKTWKTDGSEDEKGAWNVMVAAMQNRSSAARACIAVAPNNTLGWKAAVGYTPGSTYRVVKYVGK